MSRQFNEKSRLAGRIQRQNDVDFSTMTNAMNSGRFVNRGGYAHGGYNNNRGNRGYSGGGGGYSGGYRRGGYDRHHSSSRSSVIDASDDTDVSRNESYITSSESGDDSDSSSPVDRRQPIEAVPVFSEEENSAEKEKLELIHQVIQDKNPQSVEELFNLVSSAGAIKKKMLFRKTSAELKDFLNDRRFLFSTSIYTKRVQNRGFAHRKGILKIVQFVRDQSFHLYGCRLSNLLKYVQRVERFPVYMADKWSEQPWNDSYFFFEEEVTMDTLVDLLINEHPELFEVNGEDEPVENGFVKLKLAARRVPSLWDRSLLPKRPHVKYWDHSRNGIFYCRVVVVLENYIKGIIQMGDFFERRVYILAKELGLQEEDLRAVFYPQQVIAVNASITLNHKNDFRADDILSVERVMNKDSLQRTRTIFDLDSRHEEAPAPASAVVSVGTQEREFLQLVANSEMRRVLFVDEVFNGEKLTADQLRDRIIGAPGSPFDKTSDIVDFIKDRPYLYEVNNETCTASALAKYERDVYNLFFSNLAQAGCCGIPWTELQAKLKGKAWGEDLQTMALEGQLPTFLERMKVVISEIVTLHPAETRIVLDGSYMSAERLLVQKLRLGPGYY